MAELECNATSMLMTTDMLLDGVHFDTTQFSPEQIGRKAIACSLSDCAAMAVNPIAATLSLAGPRSWPLEHYRRLIDGARALAGEFDCEIVGGDTNVWKHPLVIDVTIVAIPYDNVAPVYRNGARAGDRLFVTGTIGGSGLQKHMHFTPRVHEARHLRDALGTRLHAMLDISDGLSIDLHRLCEASNTGATLEETLIQSVISHDAITMSKRDGRTPLEHAIGDGEDFELLLAVESGAAEQCVDGVELHPVGTVTDAGLRLQRPDGKVESLPRIGYEHG